MNFLNLASGVSLIFTFTTLGLSLTLLWSLPEQQEDLRDQGRLCLPCRQNSTDTCCGCNSEALKVYVDKSFQFKLQRMKDEEEATKNKTKVSDLRLKTFFQETHWTVKPAARLTGTTQPPPRPYDNGMFPVRAWKEGQRSFRRYGIQYKNGRLIVPIPGTYNIYSYLDLYELAETNSSFSSLIEHQMVRYNIQDGKNMVLASNMRSHEVPQNDHFNIYDSYLTAAVRLEAGDEIYVTVSDLSYIQSPSSNYFGVYMI